MADRLTDAQAAVARFAELAPLVGACPAELPLGGGWPCLLDVGHDGDHGYTDGEVTVTWSRRLDDSA